MDKFTPFLLIFLSISSAQAQQIQFADVTNQSGLQFIGKNYGMAIADFDRDGYEDIFAISHGVPCRLYRNNRNGTFTDVAAQAGVAYIGTPNVAGWADVNNDGFLDLFIGNKDENNVFYLGNSDGTFTEHTFLSGLLQGGKAKAVLFADVNLDGKTDIYLVRLLAENILFLNFGNNQFINFTNASGAKDDQISMGAIFFDYDNDGDPDLYLTHDANQPNILYRNNGQGYFTNVSEGSGANIGTNGMGVDFADINHDGWFDIYITNLYGNSLLLNQGMTDGTGPTFIEIGTAAGVDDIGMGWGCTFFDMDNDGFPDIYAANDSYFAPLPNVLYRNNGDLTFSLIPNTPLESLQPGYGTAATDFNLDGKMDIYLANYVGTIGNQLFRNDSPTNNNWVKIKAQGTTSNRDAIGARVTVEAGGLSLVNEIKGSSGYASQNGFTLHFGLGTAHIIDQLTIRWPNGLIESFQNLPVNLEHFFIEGQGLFTPTTYVPLETIHLSAAPNPFHDMLTIHCDYPGDQPVMLSVFDLHGKKKAEKQADHFPFHLHMTDLAPGVYFLKMTCMQHQRAIRVVKSPAVR